VAPIIDAGGQDAGIISEVVPRDVGSNIALAKCLMQEGQALSEVTTATPDEKERRFL
jgi:hypothetical protein